MNDYCKILDKNESFYKNLDMLKVPPSRLGHLYVNDKYKFIHCMIPKIGCTNWKRLFLGLAGVKSPFVRQLSVHRSPRVARMRLSNYTPDEIAYRLQHYTKSIAVRDPMERVLSAFRSKLSSPGKRSFHEKYGAEILQKYHPDLPQYVLDKGMGVTFQDFVHHLTHPMDFPDLKPTKR
ncbi:carbohydrate sulfotransferase 14-like [Lineus longissimus]|uniref:carbohydrate sulfotransferase 14-like n=1 Tax=Lineus longissimus TaxID=88925 RepID=UPI00315D3D99